MQEHRFTRIKPAFLTAIEHLFCMYNPRMFKGIGRLLGRIFLVLAVLNCCARAQDAKPGGAANANGDAFAAKGANLAESGRCADALPLLKKSIRHVKDEDLRKRAGLDGLHCAMTSKNPYDAMEFLQ